MLRFAILSENKKGELSEAIPGYTEGQLLALLKAKTTEKFLLKKSFLKRLFTTKQCLDLVDDSFKECISDLKKSTISYR